jgi:hypothetical protein
MLAVTPMCGEDDPVQGEAARRALRENHRDITEKIIVVVICERPHCTLWAMEAQGDDLNSSAKR